MPRQQVIHHECRRLAHVRHLLDAAFHFMHVLAQPHCPGHAGTALDRVQQTQQCLRRSTLTRALLPGAQQLSDLRQHVAGFLDEHRHQVGIEFIADLQRPPRPQQCLCIELGVLGRHCRHVRWQCHGALAEAQLQSIQRGHQWRFGGGHFSQGKQLQHAAHSLQRALQRVALFCQQHHWRPRKLLEYRFQDLRDLLQRREADSCRGSGQRMCRMHGRGGYRTFGFVAPLVEILGQYPQQFIGFGKVDIMQGNADFQIADLPHRIVARRRWRLQGRKLEYRRAGREHRPDWRRCVGQFGCFGDYGKFDSFGNFGNFRNVGIVRAVGRCGNFDGFDRFSGVGTRSGRTARIWRVCIGRHLVGVGSTGAHVLGGCYQRVGAAVAVTIAL